ncbi:MAG: TonB-dependent receptor plug domain-containing protein, partial [Alphaproteobacteria bacterium]|nr:TonB-dependent receptor plug domain-containing protein [Alphaproteobacteria bacterium]
MGVDRKKTCRAALFASAACAALAVVPVSAASTQDIETVVVTATKTHQTLKEAPVAASVIAGNKIGPGGIQNIADLQAQVPNLSVGNQFGVARIFIRGIGMTSIDLGGDGAVAVLEDGAMIARPAAQLLGFYDLSRVEVLRGPQGTTYGRGATAGAINLVTAKPTDYLTGYAHVTAGNYNLFSFEGAVSGPLNDSGTLMGRLATDIQSRGGYGKNLFTGAAVDDHRSQAYRGTLEWKPRSDLDVELIGEYYREHDHDYAFHYFGTTVVPENKLAFNYLPGGQTIFGYYASLGKAPNLRNIYSDQEPINRRESEGATAIVTWTPGALTFTSTTS